MTDHGALSALSEYFGILPTFFDYGGQERVTNDDTRRAFLAANGIDVSSEDAIAKAWHEIQAERDWRWFPSEVIVEAFQPNEMQFGLGATWEVRVWGEARLVAEGPEADFITLPPLDPNVYEMHVSVADRCEVVRILSVPSRLPQLSEGMPHPKIWGITAALYGLQSAGSTAIGSFDELAALCEAAGAAGAAFVGINPIHNMGYADKTAISPYSSSHRGFFNSDYIALATIPGLARSKAAKKVLSDAAPIFAKIKNSDLIDYESQQRHHHATLESLFEVFCRDAPKTVRGAFAAFKKKGGAELARFTRFEALSEVFGPDWRHWPEAADADEAATPERQDYHSWLQWVSDHQLNKAKTAALKAGMPLGLYLDLAVGSRPDGAESWCEQGAIAAGVSIGAPPDQLGPDGQNWNLAAFSPRKLQAEGYAPLRRILSQTMRHAGIIRIDHVLGLNRSFWIPNDGSPGAYIRQPMDSLVAIIKIEAYRSGTVVVGEDLGLVPNGFRDTMQAHGFYGYSVLQYEKEDDGNFRHPKNGPEQVISCFGTHDTPTIRGFETAHDIDWWEKLGSLDAPTAHNLRDVRHHDVEALKSLSGDHKTDLVAAVHAALATGAAEMICLQLDDILEQKDAQNLPGTIDEHPNWRRRHTVPVDELARHETMIHTARLMKAAGRSSDSLEESETSNDF